MKSVLYQHQHIENLKSVVLRVADIDAILPADCYSISLKIADTTGKQVSETTLKRIFGFTTSANYRPSRYTLNVLSEFTGFADWATFCAHTDRDIARSAGHQSWAEVRTVATRISLHHVQGNRYQCGVPYERTVARQGLEQYLREFIDSNCTVCMAHGDTGAGKTIALTRWVENRINESVQDIVLFTSSHAILQHLMLGYDGNRWLAHVLELVSPELVNRFMSEHADRAPGKFFLIVDEARFRFERQPPNHTVFAEMVNMVSYFSRFPWFRMILVMRSTTFDQYHKEYANLLAKPQWFVGKPGKRPCGREPVVKAFSDAELTRLLANINDAPAASTPVLPPILEPLRLPRLFQYFYELENGCPALPEAQYDVLFGVYHRYITRVVGAISLGVDTQVFLEGLVRLVKRHPDGYCVSKKKAMPLIISNRTCYRALLNSGLIEKVIKDSDVLDRSYIRFQSDMVLSYFLASIRVEQGEGRANACGADPDTAINDLVGRWTDYFRARSR